MKHHFWHAVSEKGRPVYSCSRCGSVIVTDGVQSPEEHALQKASINPMFSMDCEQTIIIEMMKEVHDA